MRGFIGFLTLGLGIALAVPAAAREASYCGGRIVAERFSTRVLPGPGGRANYSVVLRNTRDHPQDFRLVVRGGCGGRGGPPPQPPPPAGPTTMALGYSPNLPGVAPLRGDQIAQLTRLTCR